MTPEEFKHLEEEYWKVMPEWMRQAYHNENVIHTIIQRCLHLNIPANQLVSKVAECLLAAYKTSVQVVIDAALNSPNPLKF